MPPCQQALYIGSKHSREVTECLIRSAFHHLTAMESLLWATPGALPAEEMKGVLRSFSVLAESEIEGLCVYSASRDKHLPHLAVRKAVVDDHDDLLPVLER